MSAVTVEETDHFRAVLKSVMEEFPDCGVVLVVVNNSVGRFEEMSNMPNPVVLGHLEHVLTHLRNKCESCR